MNGDALKTPTSYLRASPSNLCTFYDFRLPIWDELWRSDKKISWFKNLSTTHLLQLLAPSSSSAGAPAPESWKKRKINERNTLVRDRIYATSTCLTFRQVRKITNCSEHGSSNKNTIASWKIKRKKNKGGLRRKSEVEIPWANFHMERAGVRGISNGFLLLEQRLGARHKRTVTLINKTMSEMSGERERPHGRMVYVCTMRSSTLTRKL